MSTGAASEAWPPLPIGAFLRFALDEVRQRIYAGAVAAGFDDVRPSHVTLFRWPGPDGRRPTQVAGDVGISKQRVNDLLRDLERLEYLELQPDPDDSRARIIRLTDRGRRLHAVAVEIHAELEREWAAAVGKQRYEQMRRTLMTLATPRTSDAMRQPRSRSGAMSARP
jgi:DNA-binding MarR family transcriptional regulator